MLVLLGFFDFAFFSKEEISQIIKKNGLPLRVILKNKYILQKISPNDEKGGNIAPNPPVLVKHQINRNQRLSLVLGCC